MSNKLLSEKYEYFSNCKKLENLKKEKYEYILRAKKLRNRKLCITVIGMFITMIIALLTVGFTCINSMSSDTLTTIRSIGSKQIELQKEKSDNDINNVLNIVGKASDAEENIYNASLELKKSMNRITCSVILCLIIGTITTYTVIKHEENKASEYETFEIMIDARIEEIKEDKIENEAIKRLEEIKKTVEGTQREVETLNIIFSNLQK